MVSVTMNDLHKPALDQVLILISVEDGFCVSIPDEFTVYGLSVLILISVEDGFCVYLHRPTKVQLYMS